MILKRRKSFDKSFQNAHKRIAYKVIEVLDVFKEDHFARSLNNHALHGKRVGFRSINVTGDRRIIFKELSDGKYELVELIELGTHSQLYG